MPRSCKILNNFASYCIQDHACILLQDLPVKINVRSSMITVSILCIFLLVSSCIILHFFFNTILEDFLLG